MFHAKMEMFWGVAGMRTLHHLTYMYMYDIIKAQKSNRKAVDFS